MRRPGMVWLILMLILLGCRAQTPAVPTPLAWEVQAMQTAQARPTSTPYQRWQPTAVEATGASTIRPTAAAITTDHYQVNTVRQANGRPTALILRSLAPLNIRELVGNSSLTPILAYYHPHTDNLPQLIVRCNGLPAETIEAEQVIMIPLLQTGQDTCSPTPELVQRYLPLPTRSLQEQNVQADERVLVYFTQVGETLSALAHKFGISVERLRELNSGLDAAPTDLPLRADTLVYLRLPAQYRYTPHTVAAPTPAAPKVLVFTQVSGQAATQPTAVPQQAVAEAQPTPTAEPAPSPPTATPEPTPVMAVAEAMPTPTVVEPATAHYTTTLLIADSPLATPVSKSPEGEMQKPPTDQLPADQVDAGNETEQILQAYVHFLNGEPFSSQAILSTPPLTDGQPITLDGDAALKYLSKKNLLLGNAISIAVRAALHGSTLELPATGFYNIPAGMQLDLEAIRKIADPNQGIWMLSQQDLRDKGDKLIQTAMKAYDQLLKDRPNLQFLALLKEDETGQGRLIAYIYESTSQENWTTLSGKPLNLDGCPEQVQLIMLVATYDWKHNTVEFQRP